MKAKSAKSVLALGLSVIMITSLAACGGSTDTKENGSNKAEETAGSGKKVTFPLKDKKKYSVFYQMNGEYELQDNVTMQTLLNDANIEFDYQSVMGSDFSEKRNLVLSSGDYPDIFFKSNFWMPDLNKYGKQGIFLPLEDMIKEYAPNLTKKLDELDGWKYLKSGDGHIYSLPEINRQFGAVTPYWLNKKWMDNLGLKEPTNLDELYEVLKAFKEQDANGNGDPNDEIPITATDAVRLDLLLPYFDVGYDSETKTAVIDDKLTYLPTSDVYKKFVEFVTKLYQEGILDKNAFTQKHEQQGAIGQSGDVLGSFFDAGAFLTVGRERDQDYQALTPFKDGTYPLSSGFNPGALILTDKCKDPEVIIAWADQFYTEEGGISAILGIEGKTWQKREDGDWEWIVGKGYGDDIAAVRASSTIQGAANHPSIWPDFWYEHMSPEVDPNEVYLNSERQRIAEKGKVALPVMQYSDEDAMTIATLKTDIDSYIDQYLAQVATGALDLDKSWDDYKKTLDNMGAGQLTDIYQKAYKEGMKNSNEK